MIKRLSSKLCTKPTGNLRLEFCVHYILRGGLESYTHISSQTDGLTATDADSGGRCVWCLIIKVSNNSAITQQYLLSKIK